MAYGRWRIADGVSHVADRVSQIIRRVLDGRPHDRMGEPDEIARVAVFLVSDAASYLTGCTVYVDGGMTDYPDFAHGG